MQMQAIFLGVRDVCGAGFSRGESPSYETGDGTHFWLGSLEYRAGIPSGPGGAATRLPFREKDTQMTSQVTVLLSVGLSLSSAQAGAGTGLPPGFDGYVETNRSTLRGV